MTYIALTVVAVLLGVYLLVRRIRKQARREGELEERLAEYEAAIRSTIGLRQQSRLPDDFAADVASCLSEHRDLTLYF